ncbi:MAG: hypothetical protein K2M25_07030, partial [Muribaculaceae bacterium]|nr:hypothetical protein [Muribaculaceae bacterium]
VDDSPEIPVFLPGAATDTPTLDIDIAYNPFEKQSGHTSTATRSSIKDTATDWESLYKGFESAPRVSTDELRSSAINGSWDESSLSINGGGYEEIMSKSSFPSEQQSFMGDLLESESIKGKDEPPRLIQLKNRYIVSPSKSGLTIIDRHRAHVLVLYNRYLEMVKTGNVSSQKVIFPEVLTLTASQNVILDSIVDKVTEIGFEISFLGDNSWAVNGVPSLLGKLNPVETLSKMIDNVAEGTGDVDTDLNHRIALAIAKASAVTSTTDMTDIEVESLLSELFSLASPGLTPDGLTVVSVIGFDDLSRLFN